MKDIIQTCQEERFGSTLMHNKDFYLVLIEIVIFRYFGRAVFEVVGIKGPSRLLGSCDIEKRNEIMS